jgi:hypothetical protein
MTLLAALGSLVALVAWVLAMVLFGYAKTSFKHNGWSASYHNAMCMFDRPPSTVTPLLTSYQGLCSPRGSLSLLPSASRHSAHSVATAATATPPRPAIPPTETFGSFSIG